MKIYLFIFTLFYSLTTMAIENIQVYSTDSPPFLINMEKGEGMLYDFVNELNLHFKGKYIFTANFVTRARLKILFTKKDNTMIAPFVSPLWFADVTERKYYWTQKIADDCNVISMKRDRSLKVKSWSDLQGMSTSILNGHVNTGVQKIMMQEKIKVEGASHIQLEFLKLDKDRIDFIVTGYSISSYVIKNKNLLSLRILDNPIDTFNRKVLISSKSNRTQGLLFKEAISKIIKSGKIDKIYKKYNLSTHPGICNNILFPN